MILFRNALRSRLLRHMKIEIFIKNKSISSILPVRNIYHFTTKTTIEVKQQQQINSLKEKLNKNKEYSDKSNQKLIQFQSKKQNLQIKSPSLANNQLGYGYYDWTKQQSYVRSIADNYLLDDLIIGCRNIIQKNITYTQSHLKFLIYTCFLFPNHKVQLLKEFLPGFIKRQQKSDFYVQNYSYLSEVRIICSQFTYRNNNKNYDSSKQAAEKEITQMRDRMEKRIFHPYNRKDLESLHKNLTFYCYQYMKNVKQLHADLRSLFYQQLRKTNYGLGWKNIKTLTQSYHRIMILDKNLKNESFFGGIPDHFKTNEKAFQNLVESLPQIFTYNFIGFVSSQDLLALNQKISECSHFQQQKSKQLCEKYAQHLVLLGKAQAINFSNLLYKI